MKTNGKTLISKMMMEMKDNFEIYENNQLSSYYGFWEVENSWIMKYGKGHIIFQYIPQVGRINMALLKADDFDNFLNCFYLEDDDMEALHTDLLAFRKIIEESGCNVKKVEKAVSKYLTKRNKIRFNL